MKNNILSAIVGAFLTWLLTIVISAAVVYITQSNLSILIGAPNINNGITVVPIIISNSNSEAINDLILSIPAKTDISNISSSRPVEITLQSTNIGSSHFKQISISKISPNMITNILIPVENFSDFELIKVINYKQKNITNLTNELVETPIERAIRSGLIGFSLFTIIYGISTYYNITKNQEIQTKSKDIITEELKKRDIDIKRVEESSKQIRQRLEVSEDTLVNYKKMAAKVQILLMSRLSDYSKELSFWRDTVRKMLYQSTGSKIDGEKLISTVTEQLKTYGTLEKADVEFDVLETMANLLKDQT